MKDTMANHCHRDRRSLSIRPGKRSRFVKNVPLAGLAGMEARMQATAKNPDSNKPSRAVRSFITTLHRRYVSRRPGESRCAADVHCVLQGGSHRRRGAMET
jgi:hypothetical protein